MKTSSFVLFGALGVVTACSGAVSPVGDDTTLPPAPAPSPEPSPEPSPPPSPAVAETFAATARVTSLAVDEGAVYWTTDEGDGTGNVVRRAKTSGARIETLAEAQRGPASIVVSGTRVAWIDTARDAPDVRATATTGGPVDVLTPAEAPVALASSESGLFLLDRGESSIVAKVPDAPGRLSIVSYVGDARALAADATSLFYAGVAIEQVSLGGSFPARVSTACATPEALVVDASRVYFTCRDGTVRAAPKGGDGATVTLLERAGAGGSLAGLAVDGASVYVSDAQAGVVLRVPKTGGAVTELTTGTRRVGLLAVDATHVYVESDGVYSRGSILRVPK